MNKKRLSLLCLAMAVAVMLATVPSSKADTISVAFQETGVNGGARTTEFSTTSGNVLFGMTYGTFVVNNVIAQGSPLIPEPNLETTSVNTSSSTAGTLDVWVTQTGLTTPVVGNALVSGFTANTFTGNVIQVTENTYVDSGNVAFGTGTLLASQVFNSIGSNSSINSVGSLGATYSETVEYIIQVGSGNSSANDTINLSAVPEPGSMLLFGTGLSGLAMALRRRKGQ